MSWLIFVSSLKNLHKFSCHKTSLNQLFQTSAKFLICWFIIIKFLSCKELTLLFWWQEASKVYCNCHTAGMCSCTKLWLKWSSVFFLVFLHRFSDDYIILQMNCFSVQGIGGLLWARRGQWKGLDGMFLLLEMVSVDSFIVEVFQDCRSFMLCLKSPLNAKLLIKISN